MTNAKTTTGGDEAFERLVEPYRGMLHAHCYRMLGSLHDAEDALQETLLRAWRGLAGFRGGQPIRPWLFKIATNVCIDAIGKRPPRRLQLPDRPAAAAGEGPGEPLLESPWLEPYPDEVYEQRESVELAFVAALQHLPARQRAVLVLREVLGFSAREVAEALETTAASVNSALQRARATVADRVPARSQQETLRELGDARVRELVERYVAAWERNDIDAIRALLVEDAIFAMPPYPEWWQGRDAIIRLYRGAGSPRLRHIAIEASGQPTVAWYVWDRTTETYTPSSLEVMTLDTAGIAQITAFVMPELFPRFGLPDTLDR